MVTVRAMHFEIWSNILAISYKQVLQACKMNTYFDMQVENNIRWLEQHKEVIHLWLETRSS